MTTRKKNITNIILFSLTLIINALGAFGYINNMSQKEVSDLYPTLITPSPFTFSIWSVIYSMVIISLILLIIREKNPYYSIITDKITPLFWLSNIFNIGWIISFSYTKLTQSTIIITLFLITLIVINRLLNKYGHSHFIKATFGIYAGWLTIATLVNISATLVQINWNQFGISADFWTTIILFLALLITTITSTNIRNPFYILPIVWAFIGIYLNTNLNQSYVNQIFLLVGITYLLILFILEILKTKKTTLS